MTDETPLEREIGHLEEKKEHLRFKHWVWSVVSAGGGVVGAALGAYSYYELSGGLIAAWGILIGLAVFVWSVYQHVRFLREHY